MSKDITPPSISSIGAPPERHAGRIVGEMLAWLHVEQTRLWTSLRGSLKMNQMGNPVGQTRVIKRFRGRGGPLLIDLELETGKRGKYKLTMVTWAIWDPKREDISDRNSPLPPYACLAVNYDLKVNGLIDGRRTDGEWKSAIPLIISRHACLRLAMRAEVKTVPDLLAAVRELWKVVEEFVNNHPNEELLEWLAKAPAKGWHMTMPRGTVAVIGRYKDDSRLVIKTILDPQ
jgi:hypothetical protein